VRHCRNREPDPRPCAEPGAARLYGRRAPPPRARRARRVPRCACRLAHTRLSIIDLSTGQQPLCNAAGTLWITFNGEIFNYLELRAELVKLGHAFRTKSDTEVIVHAYEAWGDGAFERFNGQWALALWDSKARALVLSRDRLGVRPLYYVEVRGRAYFASEVKALFAGEPSLERTLDPVG